MKKPLFAVLLIALLSVSLLAGCGSSVFAQSGAANASATGAPTAARPTEAPVQEKRITAEEAEKIALDHAGVAAQNVTRIRTEFDYDDGRPEYNIEFHADGREYDYEIHAETGKILSWDKDREN